ncbi:MAG: ABC transporter ATP-binding protein [Desulfobacteraceae bacterium]
MDNQRILTIENLHAYFYARSKQAFIRSVDNVSFEIHQGQTLGMVGESGSGKSVTALSVMGLVQGSPGVISGAIRFHTPDGPLNLLHGIDRHVQLKRHNGRIMTVIKAARPWEKRLQRRMKGIRGSQLAMIFQDPRSAMNPFSTIGRQITETILRNTAISSRKEARDKTLAWLEQVRIDAPKIRYHNNPHGLSGGMCQRAMIAMALAAEPTLLIADEPTTGLDATIQSRIVALMGQIKSRLGLTTLLISHDIDVIRQLSDRVAVMYGGTVLENGPVDAVLDPAAAPKHPYTAALLASVPDRRLIKKKGVLKAIKGDVLDTINTPKGCRFYPRCRQYHGKIVAACVNQEPPLSPVAQGHAVRCWLFEPINSG